MSDYLYNILARSFGLTETAQPLLTSLFEPPRDFKPVDALQTSAPTAESALASGAVDERERPVLSADKQPDAPAQMAQPSTLNALSATQLPAALSKTEHAATPHAVETRPRLSSVEPPQERIGVPAPAVSHVESQSEHGHASTQINLTPERAVIEPSADQNPAHASLKKGSLAEAEAVINEPPRDRAQPVAQRQNLSEPFAERQAIERALSTEKPPARSKNETSVDERPPSLSQRMNVAAPDRLPQKALENNPSVEINNITHQGSETVIVQPQVSRAVETQPPDTPQRARAAEPEQVVQVTIGRIEVRAAPPTPTRQGTHQRSAPQPSQSLEEYLRQRAQGGANR